MYDLVTGLPETACVLDLGAGGGSFDYSVTRARVLAVDLAFPSGKRALANQILGSSTFLPLADTSVDVVICNHTLEHFSDLEASVGEIGRVLRVDGYLWAAVPDGFSFDDGLYRYVFEGGGHLQRFSLDSFVRSVEGHTQLRLIHYKNLYTGFVYLNPPMPDKLVHYPVRAQKLARVRPRLLESGLQIFNYLARLSDRVFGTRLCQYGWAFTFQKSTCKEPTGLGEAECSQGDFNVCFSCGAGHPEAILRPTLKRFIFWKTYQCSSCGRRNLFSPAPQAKRVD